MPTSLPTLSVNHVQRLRTAAVVLIAAFLVCGALLVMRTAIPVPLSIDYRINYYFGWFHDLPVSAIYAAYAIGVLRYLRANTGPARLGWLPTHPAVLVVVAAVAVAIAGLAGSRIVMLSLPLSMDEFFAEFDARVLAAGHLLEPVAPEWRSYVQALQPLFRIPVAGDTYWMSGYLPSNSAIRAVFHWVGYRGLASPALAAVSVVLLYGVARQLWPDDRRAQIVAVLLFSTSSQFLLTAMTPYAMTAHVTFNLAWLWLVLRDRPWGHVAAIVVSFVASGLHQVVFHPLFVAPFIVLMWFSGRRGIAVYYAVALTLIGLFWLSYGSIALGIAGASPAGAGSGFERHLARLLTIISDALQPDAPAWMANNLLRLSTWQNPLTFLLVIAACLSFRSWPRPFYALAGGIVLTVVAMVVLMPFQGHGWGYRYLHGCLGSLALLGTLGWKILAERHSVVSKATPALLWSSVVVALAVLLPIRAYQANAFTRPYAEAIEAIRRIPADIVGVDRTGLWYGIDLVRNDPFLRRTPKVVDLYNLRPAALAQLCSRYKVAFFDQSHPAAARIERVNGPPPDRYRAWRDAQEAACPNRIASSP